MRWPREAITGLVATGVVLGVSVPMSFAATTSSITWSKKNIQFTTYTANNVSGYVENGTTYMPVWYVLQALKKSGYVVSFNGKVLDITPPGSKSVNTEGLTVGSGNLAISFNGQVVKKVNSEVRIDPASGKSTQYIPIYYIQQILSALSFYNAWNGTTWTGQPVTISAQGADTVPVGQKVAFALGLENPDGSFLFPSSPITWSVSGPGSAIIDKNTGIFSATTPGTYDVTGSSGGFHWTQTIKVYGQAVGVELSTDKTALPADGTTTSNITVKAVDANGNVVSNFMGEVQLSIPEDGGAFLGGITSGTENQVPVYLYNGAGTASLTAPTNTPQSGEAITSSDLTSVSQPLPETITYGSLMLSYAPAVVAQIGVTPDTTMLYSDSVNSANLTLTLDDASGNPITNGLYSGIPVTVSIDGPGSFSPSTSQSTMSTYVYPSATGVTIPVYSIQGEPGNITITASGAGVSGTTTLTSSPMQSNHSLSLTRAQGTLNSDLVVGSQTLKAGTPFTLYTVTELDSKGNPIPLSDTLWISDDTISGTSEQSTQTDGLTYYSVAGSQPDKELTLTTAGTYTISTSAATGKAQFIVFNTGNAPSTTNINIRDLATEATVNAAIGSN